MAVFEPYRANEFVVEIGARESPTVSKVSGLSLGESGVIEVPEAGSNIVHKISTGVVKFQPLTIERYVDGSQDDEEFQKFFEDTFKLGEGIRGSKVRRNGAIVKKHGGREVFRIVFYDAWVKSMAFSDFEAGSNNILKQTVVLEVDALSWVRG